MTPVRHLYVHLPFCASRCGYCAFVVEVGALDRRDAYLGALVAELEREAGVLGPLETVFLGGGTPTLMRPRRLRRLMEAIGPHLAEGAEVTIEANPETVDRPALSELRGMGVTRLSLGVQSFRPHLLGALDRAATPEQSRDAFGCARAAGFEDIGIDLLFAVPGQTPADLEADMAEALALGPDHLSWYELELKPGCALARNGTPPADEDESRGRVPAHRGGSRGRRLPLVRDGQLRPPRPRVPPQPGLLGRGRLPRDRGRRREHGRGPPLAQLAGPGRLHRGRVGGRASRPAPRSAWTPTTGGASGGCWACGWTARCRWPGPARPTGRRRSSACARPGSCGRDGRVVALTRRGRFVQNAVLHELMDYA